MSRIDSLRIYGLVTCFGISTGIIITPEAVSYISCTNLPWVSYGDKRTCCVVLWCRWLHGKWDDHHFTVLFCWGAIFQCANDNQFSHILLSHSCKIEAFATILLFWYAKLLSVSFDPLVPTLVYHNYVAKGWLSGSKPILQCYNWVLGDEHLLFAVLVLLVFILFHILLPLLYPMCFFQQCIGCYGVSGMHSTSFRVLQG